MKKILSVIILIFIFIMAMVVLDKEVILTEQMDIIYNGDREKPIIYLTFDDGFSSRNTFKILDTLKEKKVYATFFLYGDFMKQCPTVVSRILEEGHNVCNHTQNHKRVDRLNEAQLRKEILNWEKTFSTISSQEIVRFFRPPQGFINQRSYQIIKELGYAIVNWDVQIYDYDRTKDRGIQYVIEGISKQTVNGSIILMHTMTDSNANALGSLIDKLRTNGFKFGNLEEYIYMKV